MESTIQRQEMAGGPGQAGYNEVEVMRVNHAFPRLLQKSRTECRHLLQKRNYNKKNFGKFW